MTERAGLTPRQRDLFNAIERHYADHGCAPTFEHLKNAIGLRSKAIIHRMVGELVARGWITYAPKKRRSIAIVDSPKATFGFSLPPDADRALRVYCAMHGQTPSDVVARAVRAFVAAKASRAAA